MEHLLYGLENYSAKIWDLLGHSMTLAISQHTGDYIPSIVLTPLQVVFNEHYSSILIHFKDSFTWKVLILLLQEIKQDTIFHHAQLQSPRRRKELNPRIKAHLIPMVNKIESLLEYQGALQYSDSPARLSRIIQIVLHVHA
jgi:hypothetical protein